MTIIIILITTTTTSNVHILRQNEWTSNFSVFAPNPMMYLKKKTREYFLSSAFTKYCLFCTHTYTHVISTQIIRVALLS